MSKERENFAIATSVLSDGKRRILRVQVTGYWLQVRWIEEALAFKVLET